MARSRCAVLVGVLAAAGAVTHRCVHHEMLSKRPHSERYNHHVSPQQYLPTSAQSGGSIAPLRITPIYNNIGAQVNASFVSLIVSQLMPGAISKWSAALSTTSVVGPLFTSRACTSFWQSGTVWPCKTLQSAASCDLGDGNGAINFNSSWAGAQTYYPNDVNTPVVTPAGTGLPGTDFGVIVTALGSSLCGSGDGGDVIAYAGPCQRDQFDRPAWGRINFCPRALSLDPTQLASQVMVAMHELGHSLGFTSDSWPLFRYNDTARTPRTPRNVNKPNVPSSTYTTTDRCSNAAYFPTANTVAYFDERGMSCVYPSGMASSPSCVHKFVTPAAAAAAQWFFNCSSLNGAELEDQFLTSCDLQSSHWDQRILAGELMAPVIVGVPKVSPITLGLMQDSGWYVANFSATDGFRVGRDWGFSQGCSFATDKCINAATSPSSGVGQGTPPHFYYTSRDANSGSGVCDLQRTGIAYVGLSTYSAPLEAYFQYYSGSATTGGAGSAYYDYCPVAQAYSNRVCSKPSNQFNSDYLYGMRFSASSMCALSTLRSMSITPNVGLGSGCYPMACNSTTLLTIFITPASGTGVALQVQCTPANAYQGVGVAGFNGQITCPDPASICGTPQYIGGPAFNGSASNDIPITPSAFPSIVPSASPRPTRSAAMDVASDPLLYAMLAIVAAAALVAA